MDNYEEMPRRPVDSLYMEYRNGVWVLVAFVKKKEESYTNSVSLAKEKTIYDSFDQMVKFIARTYKD